jgi:hypothetical protein
LLSLRLWCLQTDDFSSVQLATRRLLTLHKSLSFSLAAGQLSLLTHRLLSSSNPSLRITGLKLVRQLWHGSSPSSQDIFSHFIQDIDPGVRVAALKGMINSHNSSSILAYFADLNGEVQIAAMRIFVKNSRAADQDAVLEKLVPQTFSNNSSVVLETLKLIGTLRPSVRAMQKSLTIDDKVPYSGFLLFVFESECCDVRVAAIEAIRDILKDMLPNRRENYAEVVYLVVKVLLDVINDEFREVRILVFKFLSTLTPFFLLKKVRGR